ncbi:MAG TPA: hypothetical protein VMR74_10090 [Gammaproteobacteria bacterium]|nr:hypothetical protein [Gammaproteobacteria bacterium]
MRAQTPIQTVLALCACLAAAPSWAVDPDELNLITFQNRTGGDIRYIFLSPTDSQYWGTDILGSTRVLGDDEDLGFYIHYPDACNEFDIIAIGSNDEAFVVYGYEICDDKEAEVRLTGQNLNEDAPRFDFTTVEIANDTDYEIWYLFFSPGDSDMWGVDQLDKDTVLDSGDSVRLLLPQADEDVRYDVRAVDEDEDTYTFYIEVGPAANEYRFSIVNSDLD